MKQELATPCDGMLEIFGAYGAEYIFSSPGSEWSPLWDALARAGHECKGPRFVNTRHEELAVSVASGYYRLARKLPVVALHSSAGTLHGAMALREARRERTPMVVLAGSSAGFGEMEGADPGEQWVNSLSDVGGPAAVAGPFVKRSSTVTCREVLTGMLQDACRLALTPPMGPVFLVIPFEFMLGPCVAPVACGAPPPLPTQADPAALEDLATQLVQARRPVVLVTHAGRDPLNLAALVDLAESLALPVVEVGGPDCLNFPRSHPLHQGFDAGELLSDADLLLLVAARRPWYPPSRRPEHAKVIVIDEHPAYEFLPYWGYSADCVIAGELNRSLRGIGACVRRLDPLSSIGESVLEARRSEWQSRHNTRRDQWRAGLAAAGRRHPVDGNWAASILGDLLPQDAIVVEEVITHKSGVLRYLDRDLPGTYQSRVAGGLGVGVGMALGARFASPGKLVALVVGDGAFNYGPVLAGFGFAQQFESPILVVIMNNQGYSGMKLAHLDYFPDGWAVRTGRFFGSEIEPAPDYAAIARAFGGYGERVEKSGEVPGAIKRAIARVEGGQLALVDLVVGDGAIRG